MDQSTLTKAHLADLRELTGLAERDLRIMWRDLTGGATDARDALMSALPELVALYGSAAATLGADWYDEMREAAEVAGRFSAVTAELPDEDRFDALARWAVAPLFSAKPDRAAALSLATGGLQRIIADADRNSVRISSVADPKATGWQRRSNGGCSFCQMVAGRGVVFTKESVDFASHDHCSCLAVPAFGGKPLPVKPFTPSLRESTDADRARVRDYIRANNL